MPGAWRTPGCWPGFKHASRQLWHRPSSRVSCAQQPSETHRARGEPARARAAKRTWSPSRCGDLQQLEPLLKPRSRLSSAPCCSGAVGPGHPRSRDTERCRAGCCRWLLPDVYFVRGTALLVSPARETTTSLAGKNPNHPPFWKCWFLPSLPLPLR